MDPTRSAQHPFSRPQSHQVIPDPRFPPIPPSPYSAQPAAPQPESLHMNDPFLRRRNDNGARQNISPILNQPPAYAAPKPSQHPSNTHPDYSDPVTGDATAQQRSQASETTYGNGRGERYSNRSVEGMCFAGLLWGSNASHHQQTIVTSYSEETLALYSNFTRRHNPANMIYLFCWFSGIIRKLGRRSGEESPFSCITST